MSAGAPVHRGDDKPPVPVSAACAAAMMGQTLDGYNRPPAPTAPQQQQGRPADKRVAGRHAGRTARRIDASSNSEEPAKKRRRNRKGLGKRFQCTADGCGKNYSRAEHLNRHRLNHSSKQILCCEYPGCPRTFVRGDLLKRHMDRHAARGPHLGRSESIAGHLLHAAASEAMAPDVKRRPGNAAHQPAMQYHSPPQEQPAGSPYASSVSGTPPAGHPNNGTASSHAADAYGSEAAYEQHLPHSLPPRPPAASTRPSTRTNLDAYNAFFPQGPGQSGNLGHHHPNVATHTPAVVAPDQNQPMQYSQDQSDATATGPSQSYGSTASTEYPESARRPPQLTILDQMALPGAAPVFGDDGGLNKSPYFGMPEDFMAYLFNSLPNSGSSAGQAVPASGPNYGDLQSHQYSSSYLGNEKGSVGFFPTAPQQVMAVNNLLDQNVPEASISEEKSAELFDFIRERFHENDLPPMERQKESIVGGDRADGNHMLSRRMMQAYICSYWYHFSDQMPILHRPSFCSDKTPTLLLLAMMTTGAACLERTHGHQATGARVSSFLARHLRWEIFMDWNFRPPAKLWVFQALILLELYEKMYSTRELHERAHIHHATTITLMRRGRSLIGKSTSDSSPNPRGGQDGPQRALNGAATQTQEEWWCHWITGEATRRAAFAAFVVDTTHATMFGHSGVMAAHELRLALPCDEALWRATNSAEGARVESSLCARGIKPMSFLEGLKRTLSHQEVRTTSFGRTVLVAGLLSVKYHMHQRDLQVNVPDGGVIHALDGRDNWRATLTRAYDSWKADFDKALEQSEPSSDPYRHDAAKHEFNIVFASRTVLHHLAHMAMHADIVDCQIFARAKQLLGRTIGSQELSAAQRRIRESWAHTEQARDATYYALKFLSSVLLPGPKSGSHAAEVDGPYPDRPYEAQYDVLMNRPWVLYFAALVVWCYGFALEGPCTDRLAATTPLETQREMWRYLLEYGSIADPSELHSMRGVNNNTALLMVLKASFERTQWDLLHEGANLLRNCIVLNRGGSVV